MRGSPIWLDIPERDDEKGQWFALIRIPLALVALFATLWLLVYVSAVAWVGAVSVVATGRLPSPVHAALETAMDLIGRAAAYLLGLTDTVSGIGSSRVEVTVPDRPNRLLAALLALTPMFMVGYTLLLGGLFEENEGWALAGLVLLLLGGMKFLLIFPQVSFVIWFGGLLMAYGALAAIVLLTFGRPIPAWLNRMLIGWLTWFLWTLAWFYGLADAYPLPKGRAAVPPTS